MNKRGTAGECAASEYLTARGYEIFENNYRSRFGEIDIIAARGGYIVFVEVKSRKKGSMVSGIESIDRRKMSRIRITAESYLIKHGAGLQPRFDVIILELSDNKAVVVQHIENAF